MTRLDNLYIYIFQTIYIVCVFYLFITPYKLELNRKCQIDSFIYIFNKKKYLYKTGRVLF